MASLPLLLQEPLVCLETALPRLLGQYEYLGPEESEDYSYGAQQGFLLRTQTLSFKVMLVNGMTQRP